MIESIQSPPPGRGLPVVPSSDPWWWCLMGSTLEVKNRHHSGAGAICHPALSSVAVVHIWASNPPSPAVGTTAGKKSKHDRLKSITIVKFYRRFLIIIFSTRAIIGFRGAGRDTKLNFTVFCRPLVEENEWTKVIHDLQVVGCKCGGGFACCTRLLARHHIATLHFSLERGARETGNINRVGVFEWIESESLYCYCNRSVGWASDDDDEFELPFCVIGVKREVILSIVGKSDSIYI